LLENWKIYLGLNPFVSLPKYVYTSRPNFSVQNQIMAHVSQWDVKQP
jgi:hypothetical protein